MSYLTDSSKLSGFWNARSQGLHRFWWGLRYAQPMTLLGTHLGRKDEYLAWFNTVETPVLRHPASRWSFCQRPPSMVGAQAFHFFGVERVLSDNRGWHWRPWGENWLHNLHAFDDLVADGAEGRFEWHEKLVTNWIVANAPGKGVGWRPPSLSRRIVNWVKWDLDKHGLNEVGRRNLVVQVRFLRQRLGVSMTAAYPTKAGKALLFAGAFFDGAEAAAWRKTGLSVLRTALKPSYMRARLGGGDGYRIAIIEDLLDVIQLDKIYPGTLGRDELARSQDLVLPLLAMEGERRAAPGLDGAEPVFFAEPKVHALRQYAQRLGLNAPA
ncbi:hypothetical protein N5K27_00005 [Pigmentiphaga sp. GD03639]|jgi:hypothetical protein|uniref:Uncharacterized protein n=1 Tax=Pigmentiphaga daeguensis TaxID=414049 RepID=A0ABN1CVV2_9BURK|nr:MULTISPECIES: hypothetical protein [unclassified Pigmentiphaga]MDH2234671.1 hypothetical protein [Pigmentiphaga sp. GD03639]OVZ64396.1 hypothetical protein CDO46_08710 [Pigmentiphaga sp. NML030171]